jgi:hypothetical protein
MPMMTTTKPSRRATARRTPRVPVNRLAGVPVASPAPAIAHPLAHEEGRPRCQACELREYLEG